MSATVVAATQMKDESDRESWVDRLVSHGKTTGRMTPPCDVLKRLVNRGMTDQEIADWTLEKWGQKVTRSGILKARQRCGLKSARERGRHEAELPWLVKDEDQHHPWARNLRLLGRKNKGLPLKRDEEGMLRKFLAELDSYDNGRGASVWYDPEYLSIRFVPVIPRREGETYVRYPDDWEGPRI